MAWPVMTASTARYMGLRTYRYSPRTTSCSVGAGGAGVPRPSTANCANDPISVTAPAAVTTPPMTRTGTGMATPARQPVSHQGTSPATTPGAITRKPALPATAVFFCTGPPHSGQRHTPRHRRCHGHTRPQRHDRAFSGTTGLDKYADQARHPAVEALMVGTLTT